MAKLDQAIAELSAKFGGAPGQGGDSMELPNSGSRGGIARGPGLPGATIGTKGSAFAAMGTDGAHGTPKSGMAGASVGTQKSGHPTAHLPIGHHRPTLDPWALQPHFGGMPGASVGTHFSVHPERPPEVIQSAAPGVSIGTRTLGTESAQSAQIAAPPSKYDPVLQRLLSAPENSGGGLLSITTPSGHPLPSDVLANHAGGGLAGASIGTVK